MQLDKVTMTGADDSVDPAELQAITRDFPFVEWGILFSPKRQGTSRYPAAEVVAVVEVANVAHSDEPTLVTSSMTCPT